MSAALNLSIPGYPSHASTAGPSVRRPHRPESGTTLQVCNRAHQANEPNPTVKEATHRRLCKSVHYYSTALHQHIIQATSTTSGSANAQLCSTRNETEIPEHTMPHDNAAPYCQNMGGRRPVDRNANKSTAAVQRGSRYNNTR
jgi:hypothetical protein